MGRYSVLRDYPGCCNHLYSLEVSSLNTEDDSHDVTVGLGHAFNCFQDTREV